MNFLDVRTVIISHFITDALCAAVLALLWVDSRKRFEGIAYWVLDLVLQTTAVLLVALRGGIPDWASMVLSNTLVVGGALLGYVGLSRFAGVKSRQTHNYILLAAFVAVQCYFAFAQPNLAVRTLNLSLGLLVFCSQCVWLVLRRVERGLQQMMRRVGYVFGGFCLVSVIRIAVVMAAPHTSNDFFLSGLYDTLILMSYQILLISLTFALVLMVNQRMRLEVQTQEEKFSKAFRSSPYAITLTRLADGLVLDVNDSFVALSGYSYTEAVGTATVALHLWASEADRAAVVARLSNGERVAGEEFQFRRKSGEMMTGLFSAEKIQIDGQVCLLSNIDDITERKQAEEALRESHGRLEVTLAELRSTQERAIQQERLAAVGQLAAGIAHDFNNILGGVILAADMLLHRSDLPASVYGSLELIKGESRRAAHLVQQLLDFGRRSLRRLEPLDLALLLQEWVGASTRNWPAHIDIRLEMEPGSYLVRADRVQVQQILANVADRAQQGMPDGGTLAFRLSHWSRAPGEPSSVPDVPPGRWLVLTVADTGVGIPSEVLPHAFEPFFTTRGVGESIGLGLAQVYGIVMQHEGHIHVASQVGEGTTFTIYLRALELEQQAAERAENLKPGQ